MAENAGQRRIRDPVLVVTGSEDLETEQTHEGGKYMSVRSATAAAPCYSFAVHECAYIVTNTLT